MASRGKFIGGIQVGVSMGTKQLKKDIKTNRGALKQFTNAAKVATKAIAGIGAAGAAAFGLMVKSQFKAVDSLGKVADKLGATTEALAGLRHAAELTGVSSNTLDMAMQRMTRRVSEAAVGTGEAQAAIKELGLDAAKLNRLSLDEKMSKFADAFGNVGSSSDRLRLAFKLFDSEGAALVNTLKLGSKGLADAAKESDELGLAISRIEVAQIEAANDATNRMKKAFTGIARTVAVQLAPAIAGVADDIREVVAGMAILTGEGKAQSFSRGPNDGARSIFREASGTGQRGKFERAGAAGVGAFASGVGALRKFGGRQDVRSATGASAISRAREKGQAALGSAGGFASSVGGGAKGLLDKIFAPIIQRSKMLIATTSDAKKPVEVIAKKDGPTGSVAFAQSGSAESFRQQARIRRQQENNNLEKKRTNDIAKIREALTKAPLVIGEANLGGA